MKGMRKFWLQLVFQLLSFTLLTIAVLRNSTPELLAAVGGNIALIGTQLWSVARELTKEHAHKEGG